MASRNPAKGPARRASATKTPPRGSSRPSSTGRAVSSRSAAVRGALDPHRGDLIGLVVIVVGALLALAVYLRVAGPLGGGIDTGLGALVGIGRFLLPPALVACGIALLVNGQRESRWRLAVGVGMATLGVLGLLHVARGPSDIVITPSEVDDAGGWSGAVVGEPVRQLIGSAGAVVLLTAVVLAGVLIATKASLRRVVVGVGRGVRSGAGPAWRKAQRAVRDMSTLSSAATTEPGAPGTHDGDGLEGPALYDYASEEGAGEGGRGRRRRALPPPDPSMLVGGQAQQLEIDLGPGAQKGQWKLPPASYLHRSNALELDRTEVQARGRVLEDSLASHGVETKLAGMTVGPTVTRYELELGSGVKVARVTTLQRDIAYAMAAADVRILAPIPGRSAIGIEVPNHTRQLVSLGDMLGAPEARQATHPLDVAIGKDIAGRGVFLNLATTPHLLIAGATGAGKSSCLNCMITSLLMRTTPEQVRLILIDPKQVEMGQYNRLPHLLTQPVTNPKKAANALGWAVKEMERRYDVLFEVGFRDITGYNAAYDRGELGPPPPARAAGTVGGEPLDVDGDEAPKPERLPYIVVVVDELNDLMMVAARDVEECITRIAQKARAVGIHLIVATQRPSVNVITGVIKANIPARVAFAVSSLTDSRVILDQPGAEKLVGQGDMLLLPGNSNVAQRIQGAFASEEEVRKVVAHWRRQAPEVMYVAGVEGEESGGSGLYGGDTAGDDEDETLLRQAMDLVVRSQLGSTSMLQRKLKVGFARAGRLMDLLEQRGVVGPSEGSKARAVLMTVEELNLLQQAERDGSGAGA